MIADENRCTAMSKQTGDRCGARRAPGRNVCRHHGGRTLYGPAHPSYKHGRYSSHLPTRLREGYQIALSDPDLLNRRQDLALIYARIDELLAKLEQGGGIERDRKLKALVKAYRSSGRISDPTARHLSQAKAITDLITLIESSPGDEIWHEIGEAIDRSNRVADGERKRLMALHATITADQAMVMIDALASIVSEEVADQQVRKRIGAEFQTFVARFMGGVVSSDRSPN